jgi:iron complex outermembrane receptor protein
MYQRMKLVAITACLIGCCAAFAKAQSATTQPSAPGQGTSGLGSLDLEDLMNMEVTSVSKSAQRISDAPAAILVISQDDIERSDLNSIPELLRLAPGLDVAQINADTWAIGSRGFNQQYDRSLLVLMDGRTLYNPASSGVYWDAQDYVLKDLDRIEVIRGPGSTLWGANAVNGVINIESKNAADTQGWLFDTHDGSDGEDASVRYGGKLDSDTSYRVYGKYRNLNNFDAYNGSNTNAH